MPLYFEREETVQLAKTLAKMTGESLTEATTTALRERIERIQRDSRAGIAERLLEIGREAAPLFNEPYKSMDHGELLHDENG